MAYEQARRHLARFIRDAWPIVEPDKPMLWSWHLDLLCECLECITFDEPPHSGFAIEHDMAPGERIRALLINEPPRSMKSLIVSVMWPCWEWANRPETRGLYSSYADRLSTELSLSRRRVLDSPWYRRGVEHFWGEPWQMSGDQNAKTAFENTRRGKMLSVSTGSSAIGSGGDRVVIDDPQSPKEANSPAYREATIRHWQQTLSTRLDDKRTGAYVVVMQRLHQADLTGHLLDEGGWTHICLPAICEVRQEIHFPRSGRVVIREPGDLLWPEREGEVEIEAVRTRLGSYGFAGQYQQTPTPSEGGAVKREWLRYWVTERRADDDPERVLLLPPTLSDHLQSWDMTYWETASADYCVGQVWAKAGANRYLLDQSRGKRDLTASKQAIRDLTAKWPHVSRKLIERAANGSEVLRKMRDEIPGLIGVSVRESKEVRLLSQVPVIESGNVVIPHPREAGWSADLIEELLAFPFGAHDDQVDAMTQALAYYETSSAGEAPTSGGKRPAVSPNAPSTGRERR